MQDVRLNQYYQSTNQTNELRKALTDVLPCPGNETSYLQEYVLKAYNNEIMLDMRQTTKLFKEHKIFQIFSTLIYATLRNDSQKKLKPASMAMTVKKSDPRSSGKL